jgi:hypothetical protein
MRQGFLRVSRLCAVESLIPSDAAEIARPVFHEDNDMFDAQIVVALFAAFLLGMVAGSGMEIIVRGGRH